MATKLVVFKPWQKFQILEETFKKKKKFWQLICVESLTKRYVCVFFFENKWVSRYLTSGDFTIQKDFFSKKRSLMKRKWQNIKKNLNYALVFGRITQNDIILYSSSMQQIKYLQFFFSMEEALLDINNLLISTSSIKIAFFDGEIYVFQFQYHR